MADNEEGEGTITRGNEWEVVSLTASAYAAAPGPKRLELNDNENDNTVEEDEAGTSRAMFMSGHFVFPPSQHENLTFEPESAEIHNVQEGVQPESAEIHNVQEGVQPENVEIRNVQGDMQGVQKVDDVGPEYGDGKGARSNPKGEENWNIKGLTVPDEFPGIEFFDEKSNKLSFDGKEYEGGTTLEGLNLAEKEQSVYSAVEFSSFHEATMGGSTRYDDETVIPDLIEHSEKGLDSDISQLPKPTKEDKHDGSDVPCEAWWKRQAAALYAHAKEANAVWSIFIAAAVMGLVIIGQRWQQERWQVLQLKWQFSISDEKMGRMLVPISRFKDVIIGGNRRGSFIRGSSTAEH